jgi:hypothetical protein
MNITKLKIACLILAFSLPLTSVSASVVTINRTVDLTGIPSQGLWVDYVDFDGPTFSLAVGDTLNLNFDFTGNQTLKMYNPLNVIGMAIATDLDCVTFNATGTLSFAQPSGPVKSGMNTESMGCSHFGVQFERPNITTGPGMIEFSGLSFSMTVNAYDSVSTRQYHNLWLTIAAEEFGIGQSSDVPEPASLGLMGLGLAGLVATRRRKEA